jgi:HD-like signal output (HDOD) protein
MNRVLFVDDEPNVLQGLKRMLRPLRNEWHMEFAGGGQAALELLAGARFDVVVTDMRMPGMDGADLLTEIMRRHPGVIRIVLSGQAEQEKLARALGATHQYLSKPCDAEVLRRMLGRACALRDLLADENLKRVVSGLGSLPSRPALYAELLEECQSPDPSVTRVASIIARDVGMTAKILHLINSAYFGIRRRISDPLHAVQLLGLEQVKGLVLWAQVFSQFEPGRIPAFSIEGHAAHSFAVSTFARHTAVAAAADPTVTEEAGVAGLLHDCGKLVLAANLPGRYAEALALAHAEGIPTAEAEARVLGATHAAVGAYLLGLWSLPDSIVQAVAFHHDPRRCLDQRFSPLTAVHVADVIVAESGPPEPGAARPEVDAGYLTELGLLDRVADWRDACRAIGAQDASS